MKTLTRRDLLQRSGLGALGLSLAGAAAPGSALAAAGPGVSDARGGFTPLNQFPRSVQEYYVRRLRETERIADARRTALRSRRDAEAYLREVRHKIQSCFGPWPEKTPLNARTTRTVPRDGYRIENVIFESRPGFPVTANLYVPTGRPLPLPAVVGTCGHSANGKAAAAYQAFAQGLARQGYVTLLFDPLGQGERMQYVTPDLKPRRGTGSAEHFYAGTQMVLTGDFLGTWMVWDGMRALDYLLTRPEVDPRHMGVTGNSGGGTQTTWLCGIEPRFTMAAPSCFVTTFRRNFENENSADPEQCPPRALALGLDHSDFLAAFAPRPLIVMGQEKDYFDARGLEEAFRRLQHLYKLLGAGQNVQLFIGPDHHGYSQLNREAMYGWFNQHTKVSTGQKEPEITVEKDETLWCTPHGQVAGLAPTTVWGATREKSQALGSRRRPLDAAALPDAIRALLKLPAETGTPEYRILRPSTDRAYPKPFAGTYAVETDPEVHAVVYRLSEERLVSRPPRSTARALLYISDRSADMELRDEALIKELIAAEPDAAVFACDVRGVGESEPAISSRRTDYFHAVHGLMYDYPTPGQRTYDVLRVINWIRAFGHREVHLAARGWGAIPATFAAVLSPDVTQVTLKHALSSYSAVAESESYTWPLSSFVPAVLQTFDLPDCYRALAARKLRLVE
jgi:dienelactone hydrolase